MGNILDGKPSTGPDQKKELKGERAHDLKNQGASEGPRQGPTQGFNLLQVSPNLLSVSKTVESN